MEQAQAQTASGEPDKLDQSGLCLLSLDGGGVRGLSTLYILKGIMDKLNHDRTAAGHRTVEPCEIFDVIGGTSTGGLIAIMLGRLEMSVDDCIKAYSELMKTVFKDKASFMPVTVSGKIKPRFDSSKLKKAIEDVLVQRKIGEKELLNNKAPRGCRVFVCATVKETKGTTRLRSYSLPDERDIPATVCEAALATSAATGFFEPVSIGVRQFVDGALGANNPVDEVEGEASDIWCPETGELKPLVKCFVSIGTGNPGKKPVKDSLWRLLRETLVEIATETENTERKFIARWRQHFDERRYFRFNVDQGLQEIGLDEYNAQGAIEAATDEYMRHQDQRFRVRDCVRSLSQKQTNRPLNLSKSMHNCTRHNVELRGATLSKEARACLTALDVTDPEVDREFLISTKGKRTAGTCEWIRDNEIYKSWLWSDTDLIWISGGPGKGKTMLSIFVTEELKSVTAQMTNVDSVFFFSSNQHDNRNTADAILKGLIYQIIKKSPYSIRHLQPFVAEPENNGGKQLLARLPAHGLWPVFWNMVLDSALSTVFCLIDGLDECDEESIRFLTAKFLDLTKTKRSVFKLAIVSRDLQALRRVPTIKLDPDNDDLVQSDIKRFVASSVEELSSIEGFNDAFRKHLESELLERSEGTFLWVGYVMSEMSWKKTCTQINEVLQSVPKGLPSIYGQMLLNIESPRRSLSRQILRLVATAVRPLDIQELAHITNSKPLPYVSDCQAVRDQIKLCGFILQIREKFNKRWKEWKEEVGFVHLSAKDYLLRKEPDAHPELEYFRIDPEKAHFQLAKLLLDRIRHSQLQYQAVGRYYSRLGSDPQSSLLEYAVKNWVQHVKSSGSRASEIVDRSHPFFQEKSVLRKNFMESFDQIIRPLKYFRISGPVLDKPESLLCAVACLGIAP